MNASDCYEQLSMMHPEVEEYKLHYAQALYKACLYQEAMKVACQIDNPATQGEVCCGGNISFGIRTLVKSG